MIIVTGAAGFIGSCLIGSLNSSGYYDIIAVDDFSRTEKKGNLNGKSISEMVERDSFFDWLVKNDKPIDFIFHIGARTDTTEFNMAVFDKLNTGYSKRIWDFAVSSHIPLVYASSAATYGLGEFGYVDNHLIVDKLQPLNPYGISKNEFDKWVLNKQATPPFWAGMKFFNVYGPNEYHKNRMASVIYHACKQVKETGKVRLFRSHRPDFEDGNQLRDFVYVKDVVSVLIFMMQHQPPSGLYNLGTGQARSYNDLALSVFKALDIGPLIEYIDTPEDIRNKYQYFTEADITKLRKAGYKPAFTSLENGVEDYIVNYLKKSRYM